MYVSRSHILVYSTFNSQAQLSCQEKTKIGMIPPKRSHQGRCSGVERGCSEPPCDGVLTSRDEKSTTSPKSESHHERYRTCRCLLLSPAVEYSIALRLNPQAIYPPRIRHQTYLWYVKNLARSFSKARVSAAVIFLTRGHAAFALFAALGGAARIF